MSRVTIVIVLLLLVTILLIVVASSRLGTSILHPSRRGMVIYALVLCVVAILGWTYISGDFAYALWLYKAPERPADEKAFVALVHEARDQWSAATGNAQDALCIEQTNKVLGSPQSVANWTGTVVTTYLIGSSAALVVQIGRDVVLRTAYNANTAGSLIDHDMPVFDQLKSIKSGEGVVFSGGPFSSAKPCLFESVGAAPNDQTEILFKFSDIKPTEG